MKSISFGKENLRPGTSYRLAEWGQLSIAAQEMLSGLYDQSEVYGIFQPVHAATSLTYKVAFKEVALLYLHLQASNYLPHYFYLATEKNLDITIAQLVLDDVLEIEYEGIFVSGPSAVKAIFGEMLSLNKKIPDRLSVLSTQAIRYALQLRDLDARSLSARLYAFNTVPWDKKAKSKFYKDHSIKTFLFSPAKNELDHLLNGCWLSDNGSNEKYWLSWWKATNNKSGPISIDKPTFKLYISPVISDLPKMMHHAIVKLTASACFSFKVGAFVEGLLRPDKMVAYFESKDDLMDAAEDISKILNGRLAAQGVPFTAQIDEAGILSWGVDPPETDVLSTIEAGSWRLQVTDQLAMAILQAQANSLDMEQSIQFIRAKLFSVGIDTADWTSIHHNKKITA